MERMEHDPYQIRKKISEYSAGLEKSFIERRCHSHKEDILEELSEVIQELNKREKQVKSLAAIAMHLLDNNETLSQKLESTREKKLLHSEQNRVLKLDLDSIKEQLFNSEMKTQDLQNELTGKEKQVLMLQTENKRLESLIQRTQFSNSEDTEKDNLVFQLQEEIKLLHKSSKQSQKHFKEITLKLEKAEKDHKANTAHNNKLEKDTQRLTYKVVCLENENSGLEEAFGNSKEELRKLSLLYNKALVKIKNLEEELHLSEQLSTKTNENHCETYSLMSELEMINHADIEQFSNLNVENSGSVDILSTRTGQSDLCEEYFILTTQSIKMCSPHMDAICTISTRDLYNKAIALSIPFHKWHDWIINELDSIYIHNIYRCKG